MQMQFDTPLQDSDFHAFRKLIYSVAGISLSERKRELVKSRLARRLRALNLESYAAYYDLLCNAPSGDEELQQFTNCLTTNKTEFYRESHHFDFLQESFFPELRQRAFAGGNKKVRIWCAAASTGQEPYTLAMSLLDFFGVNSDWDLRILASDIDTQVLATASQGLYSATEMDSVPASHRSRYFERASRGEDGTYRVRDHVKNLIAFRQLNLNQADWPMNVQFDAIFCRNVMIYFDQATQRNLVEHFTQYLQPEGLLVIGHSESLFSISDQFESLGDTIYRLKTAAQGRAESKKTVTHIANGCELARPSGRPRGGARSEATTTIAARTTDEPRQPSRPAAGHWHAYPVDNQAEPASHTLIVGEYLVSDQPCIMRTTLGSCVAACLVDPGRGVGGMNHFMLPESQLDSRASASYGVHAMELLINGLMKLGADRRRLTAKIFGGAHVIGGLETVWNIGEGNIQFVREFLEVERIPVIAEHVGGKVARRLKFYPTTGKVFVHLVDKQTSVDIDALQRRQGSDALSHTAHRQAVTLF
ncbi:MAG: CheR family methyltransferase [Aureliella sp.]